MPEISEMTVKDFLEFRIAEIKLEINDLIMEMERVAHSPNELGFVAGRLVELNDQLRKMKDYLDKYETEMMDF